MLGSEKTLLHLTSNAQKTTVISAISRKHLKPVTEPVTSCFQPLQGSPALACPECPVLTVIGETFVLLTTAAAVCDCHRCSNRGRGFLKSCPMKRQQTVAFSKTEGLGLMEIEKHMCSYNDCTWRPGRCQVPGPGELQLSAPLQLMTLLRGVLDPPSDHRGAGSIPPAQPHPGSHRKNSVSDLLHSHSFPLGENNQSHPESDKRHCVSHPTQRKPSPGSSLGLAIFSAPLTSKCQPQLTPPQDQSIPQCVQ